VTLVELMIAIALMLILTLQLSIIFGQSQKLYATADSLAQVYSNARAALDQIERDIANAVKSDQMEFFNDNRNAAAGAGHYNLGEQNPTVFGRFIPGRYMHSFAVKQTSGYIPKDAARLGFDPAAKLRMDSMYFRTFTTVNGEPREALVEYRLFVGADPRSPRPRPILQRIVTAAQQDPTTGNPMFDAQGFPKLERQDPQDVCYYVQEFQIEVMIRDRRRRTAGRFYSAKDACRTSDPQYDSKPPALPNLLSGEDFAIECMDGKDDIDPNAIIQSDDGKLHLRNGDRVARLQPGDRMYCISRPYGNFRYDFSTINGGYLTIKDITQPSQGETVVSFEEEAQVKRFITGQSALAGAPGIEVAYRGAWLPQAIRVQMKIKDQRSTEIRTISRIFQLLRA
jgi:type II secretory pathway pseudopilin PulG